MHGVNVPKCIVKKHLQMKIMILEKVQTLSKLGGVYLKSESKLEKVHVKVSIMPLTAS